MCRRPLFDSISSLKICVANSVGCTYPKSCMSLVAVTVQGAKQAIIRMPAAKHQHIYPCHTMYGVSSSMFVNATRLQNRRHPAGDARHSLVRLMSTEGDFYSSLSSSTLDCQPVNDSPLTHHPFKCMREVI